MEKFSKNRRNFLILSSVSAAIFLTGFSKKSVDASSSKVSFGKDICDRCKMIIDSKNYVAQIVDPDTGKHYNFDDIGCAIKWIYEQTADSNLDSDFSMYVADAETSKMIDARKAFYLDGADTPMNFGFAAYETKQSDKVNFDYEYVKTTILAMPPKRKHNMHSNMSHEGHSHSEHSHSMHSH